MRYVIAIVFILTTRPVYAFDEWDKVEIGMEIAYVGLTIIDWGQTLDIENHPGIYETNPILGKHPSRGRVNIMFAAGLILQPVIAHALPHKWRKAWIGSGIMIEAGCVANNIHVGIGASF